MTYTLRCREGGWSKTFEGSEEEAIKEAERLSDFHDSAFGIVELNTGRLVGYTYIPNPVYVFLKVNQT